MNKAWKDRTLSNYGFAIDHARAAIACIETAIMACPTSEARNKLTEANMALQEADIKLRDQRKELESLVTVEAE